MIGWVVLLFLCGLALSALFSGSETGFYRVPRIRLRLDALGGDWFARGLLWLTNYPSLFVATSLIGNNIANYCAALAIVVLVEQLLGNSIVMQIVAPIACAPILFVYGELLPKSLFYYMPFRLLRRWSPLLAIFTVLFLPVSGLVWALSHMMQRLVGQSPQRLKWRLARGELTSILEEGHQIGILRPSQRRLAQGVFLLADRPVGEFAQPTKNWHWVSEGVDRDEALIVARQYEQDVLPVESANDPGCLIGYLHVPELYVDEAAVQVRVHPLIEISNTATHLAALMTMQRASQVLARIVGPEAETLGFVTTERLCQPLFQKGS